MDERLQRLRKRLARVRRAAVAGALPVERLPKAEAAQRHAYAVKENARLHREVLAQKRVEQLTQERQERQRQRAKELREQEKRQEEEAAAAAAAQGSGAAGWSPGSAGTESLDEEDELLRVGDWGEGAGAGVQAAAAAAGSMGAVATPPLRLATGLSGSGASGPVGGMGSSDGGEERAGPPGAAAEAAGGEEGATAEREQGRGQGPSADALEYVTPGKAFRKRLSGKKRTQHWRQQRGASGSRRQ